MKKQTVAFLLLFCILISALAGCSQTGKKNPQNPLNGSTAEGSAMQTSAKYVYKTQFFDLDLDFDYTGATCVSGDYLYMVTEKYIEPEQTPAQTLPQTSVETTALIANDAVEAPLLDLAMPYEPYEPPVYETTLYRIGLTDASVTKMDSYVKSEIPEGYMGESWIGNMLPGKNGTVWIYDMMESYKYDLPEDFDPETGEQWQYHVQGPVERRLQQFDADGNILKTVLLNPTEEDGYLEFAFIDNKEQIYVRNADGVAVMDTDGNTLKTFTSEENGWLTSFCGQPAMEIYNENGAELRLVDIETLQLGAPIERPANVWNFMTSQDENYDFYYDYGGDLYGYRQAEGEGQKIVSWLDCDIDSGNIYTSYILPDGRVCALHCEYDDETGEESYSIVVLTRADPSEIKAKTVLTLACFGLDWNLKNRILDFNRGNDEVRITVSDYSQYATEDDYMAGITKLNTEILSGKIPDLLATSQLPISRYAAQGVLEDLLPYIDADPELSREKLMTRVIDAACMNGKLYQAFSTFTIQTAVALEKVVEEYDSWTLAEVKDAMTKLQPEATAFELMWTRADALENYLQRNLGAFVNWETAQCSFDGEAFREILEFSNTLPEEFDYENFDWSSYISATDALKSGTQLLMPSIIYNLEDYLWVQASYANAAVRYVGYPSVTGNHNTFQIDDGLCITSVCADKDAAWQFVREVFTEETQREQYYYGLPINADVFREQVEKMMTVEYQTDADGNFILDENGEKIVIDKVSYWIDETNVVTIEAMSQQQYEQFMDIYESTSSVSTYDEDVMEIIRNETAGYFAGQKPIDETVRQIQNRVSLYVAERG